MKRHYCFLVQPWDSATVSDWFWFHTATNAMCVVRLCGITWIRMCERAASEDGMNRLVDAIFSQPTSKIGRE